MTQALSRDTRTGAEDPSGGQHAPGAASVRAHGGLGGGAPQEPPVCSGCAGGVLCYPTDGSPAFCPACCPDHDYVSEAGERLCAHCSGRPPDDWYDEDWDEPTRFFGALGGL